MVIEGEELLVTGMKIGPLNLAGGKRCETLQGDTVLVIPVTVQRSCEGRVMRPNECPGPVPQVHRYDVRAMLAPGSHIGGKKLYGFCCRPLKPRHGTDSSRTGAHSNQEIVLKEKCWAMIEVAHTGQIIEPIKSQLRLPYSQA